MSASEPMSMAGPRDGCPVFPSYVTGCSAATTPVPEHCGGSFPMKGKNSFTNSTKISDVVSIMLHYYYLVKEPRKTTIAALVVMVCVRSWVSVCHPHAVVLHGPLIALAQSFDTQF